MVLAGAATNVLAWNYVVTPSARELMRVDDNIRGAVRDKEVAWGFDSSASVNVQAISDTVTSTLTPRINIRRFVVGDDLNADEYGVTSSNVWNTERFRYGLDFNYSRDSTLSTEATDTGRKNVVVDRDNVSISPTVAYSFSDRLVLQTSYLYNSISYLAATNGELVDYKYQSLNVDLHYQLRDDIELFASTSFSYFDAGSGFSITRNYSGRGGATYHWDETFHVTGTVGWIASNVKFQDQQLIFTPIITVVAVPAHGTSEGPLASASIQKKFSQATATLDFVRQVSPSGRGAQSNSDRVSGSYAYRFTDRFNAQVDFIYDMQSADGANFGNRTLASALNRDYLDVVGTIRYKLSPEWQISTAYHHPIRQSNNSSVNSTAQGNVVYFTLDYAGKRFDF